MSFLHERGILGYVTLNTLVFPSELSAIEEHVVRLTEAGVDAVLVQDLGLVRLIHAISPDLHVHASTQMTLTSGECIRVAEELGIQRVVLARELTYFAAREKDSGRRCDIEAGMAKLLGARVAWANADAALQIHGGNGYAMEFEISRILCDARILNIFEGAAEIQAQVIARRLLEGGN